MFNWPVKRPAATEQDEYCHTPVILPPAVPLLSPQFLFVFTFSEVFLSVAIYLPDALYLGSDR